MPKPGYTQSPEHKKKRLEQIEGDGNGSYKDGRRSYRRKAGAKNNDGTVVHHKNGDRTNNCASNLERLTDGDRKPGRRTTSAHEKHHGGRHGDSIAVRLAIRNDRKTGGCGKGKVGTGTGDCRPAKGEGIRKAVRQGYPAGVVAGGIVAAGVVGKKVYDKAKLREKLNEPQTPQNPESSKPSRREENTARIERRRQKIRELGYGGEEALNIIGSSRHSANSNPDQDMALNRKHRRLRGEDIRDIARHIKKMDPSYGTNADSLIPTTIAILHHDRKTGGCGRGKVGTGTGRCKSAKLSQVTPFSHRTPQEADAARREQLLLQAAKVAVGVGVTGGIATIALKGGKHSNPYHDPPDIAPVKKVEPPASPKPVDSPVLKPPLSSREETEESLRSLSRIAPPEKTPTPPSVSAPIDKGVTAKIETPANDAPESVKKKWLITKLLPAEATVMERSAYVPPVPDISLRVPIGTLDNPSHGTQFYGLPKKSGRKRKELAKTSYRSGQLTEGEIRTRSSK